MPDTLQLPAFIPAAQPAPAPVAAGPLAMGDMADPGTLIIRTPAVAFYIGGRTPHVWTGQQIHSQTARYRHPVWVYDPDRPGEDAGIIDGHRAVTACKALGVPAEVTISADMETHHDPAYLDGFHSVVAPSGYWTGVYGSADTIVLNPFFGGGRWVADWTGKVHFTGIQGEWACQWQKADAEGNPAPWDISAVKSVTHLWDTVIAPPDIATLVRLPSGSAVTVRSFNGGKTWE